MDTKLAKKATETAKFTTSTPKKTSVYDFDPGPSISSDLIFNHGLSRFNGKKGSIRSMICEAITVMGLPTKGASYIAIQKWIVDNRKTSQPKRLRTLIKKVIAKGLATGLLKRSAFSKTAVGLQGYFIVSRKHSSENSTQMKPKKVLKLKVKKGKKDKLGKKLDLRINVNA